MAGLSGGNRALVCLAGEIDQASIVAARVTLADALSSSTTVVCIDMAEVTFFSAAGVRLLLELVERGLEVELVGAPRQVRRVLEICEVEHRFLLR